MALRVGDSERPRCHTHLELLALVWGLAEATFFFIVPDVWLTRLALAHPRRAYRACWWAAAGAVAGGTIMYLWAAQDAGTALAALDRIPAISRGLCDQSAARIRAYGVAAVAVGPLTGTPYKVYAVQAGALHANLLLLLLISAATRLARFLALAVATAWLAQRMPRRWTGSLRMYHVLLWTLFYAAYFSLFRDPVP